jgi:hypothetical protein
MTIDAARRHPPEQDAFQTFFQPSSGECNHGDANGI